ncbi:MAG: universal stress protein [Candidatus Methanoperedens sp.]|nr:universal stress protein [Candidatus Methanoperedens nitroreducens]MDJ1423218.1 universal stress protein [Candidatus Methanoperedens sp.]
MFENILFPTDFSEYAQKTLECIGEIPGVKEAVLLHVVDVAHLSKRGVAQEPYIENARVRLDEQKKQLESLGLKVKTKVDVITEGDASHAVLENVNKEKVSLVVMGAHGKSLIEGILLGSVATNVLRYGNTHVLIMRYKLAEWLGTKKFEKFCSRIFSKVLLPTDFSEPAMEALSLVKNLEGIEEAVLVHVVDRGETQEEIEANVQEAKKKLEDIKEDLSKAGLRVKAHICVGSPPDKIISVAEEEDVSLIIMSTLGKGVFRELLLGSTARDVVRQTERSVLAVRAKRV